MSNQVYANTITGTKYITQRGINLARVNPQDKTLLNSETTILSYVSQVIQVPNIITFTGSVDQFITPLIEGVFTFDFTFTFHTAILNSYQIAFNIIYNDDETGDIVMATDRNFYPVNIAPSILQIRSVSLSVTSFMKIGSRMWASATVDNDTTNVILDYAPCFITCQ